METVLDILKNLQKLHDIQIIYAVEAGSRAWGLESEDSDYDIRFIYKHNDLKKYLSLRPAAMNIDGFSEDRLYDWQGWDVTKAIKHLHQMNPSICEWIFSPIVYIDDKANYFNFRTKAQILFANQRRILPLIYHYKSMAKSNYKAHIEHKKNVKVKKYLYVIRPIGMLEWLFSLKTSSVNKIEINFLTVLNDLKANMNKECYERIIELIEKKKLMKELDEEPRIECVDVWLESWLNDQDIKGKLAAIESKTANITMDSHQGPLADYDNLLFSILNI